VRLACDEVLSGGVHRGVADEAVVQVDGLRCFWTFAVNAAMAQSVVFFSSLTSCAKRLMRSTSVPMWLLPERDTMSPSQCPGTARPSASAGRSLMCRASTI